MPKGQYWRKFFGIESDEDALLPGPAGPPQLNNNVILEPSGTSNESSVFGPSRTTGETTPSPTKAYIRPQSLYIEEDGHVRYRKTRAKTGGNEKDHWNKENLIHMKAFENDVSAIMKIVNNRNSERLNHDSQNLNEKDIDPVLSYYHLPSNAYERKKDENLIPAHIAAIGGSYDACVYLNDRILRKTLGQEYYSTIHPLHFISLYGEVKSHDSASQNTVALTNIFLNDLEIADKFDKTRTTPLHYACISGNMKMIKLLIKHGADVNAVQKITNTTPLHFACQSGDEQMVKFLLINGADPEMADSYSNSALHYATRSSDNVEITKAILRKVRDKDKFVATKNNGGITAMRLAVEENRLKVAEYLFKQHFGNYNKDENEGKHEECGKSDTLLVHLAAQRGSPQMVKLLIESGLSIEERDNRGQTPLHFAAEENHLSLVRTLIGEKADKEAIDERGFTPLLAAVSRDSLNVVKELLGQTLITALSFYGENIVLIAVKYNARKVVKFLFSPMHKEEFKVIVTGMLKKVDINLNCALHFVAEIGDIEIFKIIIPFYQEINMRNKQLETPLHIAAKFGHTEVAKNLLHISVCSINLIDIYQKTPLFGAVRNRSISMIKLLLEHGANPMAMTDDKKIALDLAIKDGDTDVVKLLLDELKEDEDEYRKVFPLHDAVRRRQLKVMKLILKKRYTQIDQVDDKGQTCFDLAISENFREGVELLLNETKWERVVRRRYVKPTEENPHPQSPMQNLIRNMPDMAKIVLDKCIYFSKNKIYHNYEFIDDTYVLKEIPHARLYKYNNTEIPTKYLTPYYIVGHHKESRLKEGCVCKEKNYWNVIADHPVNLMLKTDKNELWNHDLVQSYVTTKWNKFAKWFYYLLCGFHLIFILLLTGITINIKPERVMTKEEKLRVSSTYECLVEPWSHISFLIFAILVMTLAIGKVCRDWTISNRIPDFLLSFLAFMASSPICAIMDSTNQWRTLVILNFVAWFHLLNLVRKLPRFGVYVQMVWYTIVSFIRFSPIFMLFLSPFVVSFHVLLGTERGLASFLRTMIRTLIMLTGEFDYEETVQKHPTFLTYVIFFLFISIGFVFLMNLLVGLAVSDISKALERAARTRLLLQIETINHVEVMMTEGLRRRMWRGFRTFDPEEKTSRFDMKKISYWFRWLGLPKDAIKREFYQEKSESVPAVNIKKKKKDGKLKERQTEDIFEIKNAISITQNKLIEMEKSLNDLVETLKQERIQKNKTDSETRLIDVDD